MTFFKSPEASSYEVNSAIFSFRLFFSTKIVVFSFLEALSLEESSVTLSFRFVTNFGRSEFSFKEVSS